jgi:ABC-type multidrug transport system ATPase subunit
VTAKKQHTIPFESPPEEGTHRPPALVTRNLVKAYGSRKVLRGITFAVPTGSLVRIEGENGAGKSTLLKCLVGLLRPDQGRVEATGRLGYCPQDPALIDLLTCQEQLLLFGHAYGLSQRPLCAAAPT